MNEYLDDTYNGLQQSIQPAFNTTNLHNSEVTRKQKDWTVGATIFRCSE